MLVKVATGDGSKAPLTAMHAEPSLQKVCQLIIKIWVKISFVFIMSVIISENYAHGMTAKLSRHVLNYGLIIIVSVIAMPFWR